MASSCPADFDSQNGYGCLFVGSETLSLCYARLQCKKKGADMVSPETAVDAQTLRTALADMGEKIRMPQPITA